MKTITLRQLVRETRSVKRITDTGASFLVTDNGKPLWRVSPAVSSGNEARTAGIDAELDALLEEDASGLDLSEIVIQDRR